MAQTTCDRCRAIAVSRGFEDNNLFDALEKKYKNAFKAKLH